MARVGVEVEVEEVGVVSDVGVVSVAWEPKVYGSM
jgi:hypothetical protein